MGVIHKFNGTNAAPSWENVDTSVYESSDVKGATRRILIGWNEGARHFAMRYFEIPPGGRSAYDKHAHDHGVYILKGTARLQLENNTYDVAPGDVVYIAPNETHQFENTGGTSFGFLCVVPARPPGEKEPS